MYMAKCSPDWEWVRSGVRSDIHIATDEDATTETFEPFALRGL